MKSNVFCYSSLTKLKNQMYYSKLIIFLISICISPAIWCQTKKPSIGEITSLEWTILGSISVSYAVGKSGQSIEVHCTAFNEEKKPVGGGFTFTAGGVARVNVEVPAKYKNTDKITISCTP